MASTTRKQMSEEAIIALLAFATASAPIAMDMYLPAVPDMPVFFSCPEGIVNFTLVGYQISMALGMLLFGPISDRNGRKPLLLLSLLLFVVAAFAGSIANSIEVLVVARLVQGAGGGGMVAVATAITRDCFEGVKRDRALAVVQAITMVAPMVAPIIGAGILGFTSWRGTMIAQGAIGLVALPLVFRLVEPLAKEGCSDVGLLASLGRLAVVARMRSFTLLLVSLALCASPYMLYISLVSYIYIDGFSLSKAMYSVFFAVNSAFAIAASLASVRLGRICGMAGALRLSIAMSIVAGVLVFIVGPTSPIAFLICYAVFTFAVNFSRPIAVSFLLGKRDGDAGSASALINFTFSVMGSAMMLLVGLPWPNYLFALAVCMIAGSLASLPVFEYAIRQS